MVKPNQFCFEVALKQLLLLLIAMPLLLIHTMDFMQHMERSNQSAILSVVGLLMAAAIVGVFEATYQKTSLEVPVQRYLAHATKALLFLGITELMILAIAAVGTTYEVLDDPLLWALLPVYLALYLYDWWDALVSLKRQTKGS